MRTVGRICKSIIKAGVLGAGLLMAVLSAQLLGQVTVTTEAATGVTDLNATLNGSVNSGGYGVALYFDYGTTSSYGMTAYPTPSGVSGTSTVSTSANALYLLPGTTYHYRLLAYNPVNYSYTYGQDMTFTTAAANTPPTVGAVNVDGAPTAKVVRLVAYGLNSGSSLTTVSVEYGLTDAYGSTATNPTPIPVNWISSPQMRIENLTPGTLYHYRFKAMNAQGTAYSADATFTTRPAPTLTATAASGITDMGGVMHGNASANGGFYIISIAFGPTTSYGTNYGPAPGYVSGMDSASYTQPVAGLFPNTTYHYRMVARDSESVDFYSDDMSFTTGAPATPPTVNDVSALSVAAVEATLSVFSVAAGSSPTTVSFEYGLTNSYGFTATHSTAVPTNSVESRDVIVSGLAPSTTYHYRCKAVNGEGTVYSPDQTFTTAAGPVAVTLSAASVTDIAGQLRGSVHTNAQSFVMSFEYGLTGSYGSMIPASQGVVISNSPVVVSEYVANLQPNTLYHYRVKGVNQFNVGQVIYGADQIFTTSPPVTPPSVGSVSYSSLTSRSVELQAANVLAGGSPATVTFEYGPTSSYGTVVTHSTTVPVNPQYAEAHLPISGLTPGTTYHFRCVVTSAVGSAASPDSTFTTLTVPAVTTQVATGVTDLQAVLHGTVDSSGGSLALNFDLGTTTAYGRTIMATPSTVTGVTVATATVMPTELLPLTTYHFRLRANYTSGASEVFYGNDMTFTTGEPATPPTASMLSAFNVYSTTARVQAGLVQAGSSPATVSWEYGTTTAYGSTALSESSFPIDTNQSGGAQALLHGLTPDTLYHFRCLVTNAQGTTFSADATFTTTSSPIITTGAASGVTDLTAMLSGSVDVNGTGSLRALGNISFELGTTTSYGTVTYTTPFSVSGFTSGPQSVTAQVTGLLPATTYHYRLRALDGGYIFFQGADQTFTTGVPATPPTVTTGSVTNPAASAVTLNAVSLHSGSSPTTLVFEYGATTAYGSELVHPTTLATSTSSSPGQPLTGLNPDTTYHYRARVTNEQGTHYGSDVTFTTPALPIVSTGGVTDLKAYVATLNGTYDKRGGTYTLTMDYGLTSAYGLTATAGSGGLILGGGGGLIIGGGGGLIIGGGSSSGSFVGTTGLLTEQTLYHYRLRLTDTYGNSYEGTDATFTTPTPIGGWRQQYFGTTENLGEAADDANPAKDNIPNLIKYALGMDPTKPGTLPVPQMKNVSGANYLSMIFPWPSYRNDITYEVCVADSPSGPWTTVLTIAGGGNPTGPGFVVQPHGGVIIIGGFPWTATTLVEARDIVSTSDASARFMQLRVTR